MNQKDILAEIYESLHGIIDLATGMSTLLWVE